MFIKLSRITTIRLIKKLRKNYDVTNQVFMVAHLKVNLITE